MAIPIVSIAQMRQWEKAAWAGGATESQVIEAVGRAIARRLERLLRPGETVLFLAGKGHNGDDARAARQQLKADFPSVLIEMNDPEEGLKQFLDAHTKGAGRWVVDGLFGVGLDRPLDAPWRKLIEAVNHSGAPIVAVDVPSGLNAETGEVEGAAIQAEITLTVGAPKCGLLKASKWVGRLEVLIDVGLGAPPFETELNWTVNTDFARLPPRRPVESNKGTFGHAVIFSGSHGYHGAAVLAGHGAARARPGLVTVYPQESVYVPVAAQFQSVMVQPWKAGEKLPKTCTAILFGPGLAAKDLPETMKEEVREFWRAAQMPVIADASALDWLPRGTTPEGMIRVITPHPGEAGRVLGSSAQRVQADRVLALRQLSQRLGNCFVILKGNQTLVGRGEGKIFVNNSGNPFLAQGGSGDLLGGYLAGLLAQPEWQKGPLTAIRFAVWEHGATADRLSEIQANWTIEDLSRNLGTVLQQSSR